MPLCHSADAVISPNSTRCTRHSHIWIFCFNNKLGIIHSKPSLLSVRTCHRQNRICLTSKFVKWILCALKINNSEYWFLPSKFSEIYMNFCVFFFLVWENRFHNHLFQGVLCMISGERFAISIRNGISIDRAHILMEKLLVVVRL